MKIDVPAFKQSNKLGCGPTCLSMVFSYFNKNFSEKQIIDEISIIKDKSHKKAGTLTIDNALVAIKKRFDVTCFSYNMNLLKPTFIGLEKEALKKEIKKLAVAEKDNFNKRILKTMTKLIDEKVNFRVKMPSFTDIESFIKKKIPVMIAVNSKIFFEENKSSTWSGHFIVITGFDRNKFYYNDPWDGVADSIGREKLFFALSNNILDSTAYFLAIKPKN